MTCSMLEKTLPSKLLFLFMDGIMKVVIQRQNRVTGLAALGTEVLALVSGGEWKEVLEH